MSHPRLGQYSEDSMPTQARGFRVSTQYSRQFGYKRIRAVVADDIPDMQTIMISALEHDGFVHVVGTADNGVTAVELAETLAPRPGRTRRQYAEDDRTRSRHVNQAKLTGHQGPGDFFRWRP